MAGPILIVYLDSSALCKLYLEEPGSRAVRAGVDGATEKAAARIAYAEIRAALAAAHRAGRLDALDLAQAKRMWESDWKQFVQIDVMADRCHEAGEMAEKYGLRGCCSVHLACYAHLVRTAAPEEVSFCCFDKALSGAAAQWRAAN